MNFNKVMFSFQAGFDSDHLFLADAPEMAILHSKHIKPSNSVMARGDRVMVVDLGGKS